MANDAARTSGGRAAAAAVLVAALALPATADASLTALTTAHGARGAAVARVVTVARLSPLTGGRGLKFAGQLGTLGFGGDGFSAESAQFSNPRGLAVDARGNLLIADSTNSRIRRIDTTPTHVITTIAGNGSVGFATENAPATSSPLPLIASSVAAGAHGDVYLTTGFEAGANAPVYRIDAAGRIHRFAGAASFIGGYAGDNGPASAALTDGAAGVATDAVGNVYIAEGFRIRRVNAAGIISTYAGGASEGFSGDGGPATAAKLERPTAVGTDPHGNVYVATGNRVRKITPAGIITTIAGTGVAGFSGDGGRAIAARLSFPSAVVADGAGNVYIADAGNQRVRAVTAAGGISTVAGSSKPNAFNLYGPITETRLTAPDGLALDARGDLFISDSGAEIIRELQPPLTPAAAGRCTKAAARQLVERQHLGGFTGFTPEPIAKVLCGSFLGRHSRAMIVELSRETCLPAGGWVVFRKVGRSWRRVTAVHGLFAFVFRHGTRGFTEEIPNARKNEPICTTRRWLGRNWRWNGKRLVHGRYHRVRAPTHV